VYAGAATSGFAEVNGARLWYEEAGAGQALVLLHGHLIDSGHHPNMEHPAEFDELVLSFFEVGELIRPGRAGRRAA